MIASELYALQEMLNNVDSIKDLDMVGRMLLIKYFSDNTFKDIKFVGKYNSIVLIDARLTDGDICTICKDLDCKLDMVLEDTNYVFQFKK